MNRPRVTINLVLSKYDEAITPAIESILQQSYPNLRIQIYDCCGSSEIQETLQRYSALAEVSIHHVAPAEAGVDQPQMFAMQSDDEYVLCVSPDFRLLPTSLEKLMLPTQNLVNPARVVYGNAVMPIDREIRCTGQSCLSYSGISSLAQLIVLGAEIDHSQPILFHGPTLVELGGFASSLGWATPYEMLLRCASRQHHVAHIPDILMAPLPENEIQAKRAAFSEIFDPYYLQLIEYYAEHEIVGNVHEFKKKILEAARKSSYRSMSFENQQHILQRLEVKLDAQALKALEHPSPLVSIVVVCDSMNALQHALDQLERQTYTNWELLVFQMGHTSFEGLCRYRSFQGRIRTIHAPFTNVDECRQSAHALVCGTLITYVDSTSEWHAHHLEWMVDMMQQPGVAIAVARAEVLVQDNENCLSLELPRSEGQPLGYDHIPTWIERSCVMLRTRHLDSGLWKYSSRNDGENWLHFLDELRDFVAINTLSMASPKYPSVRIRGDARTYYSNWWKYLQNLQQKIDGNSQRDQQIPEYRFEALCGLARVIADVEPVKAVLVA